MTNKRFYVDTRGEGVAGITDRQGKHDRFVQPFFIAIRTSDCVPGVVSNALLAHAADIAEGLNLLHEQREAAASCDATDSEGRLL